MGTCSFKFLTLINHIYIQCNQNSPMGKCLCMHHKTKLYVSDFPLDNCDHHQITLCVKVITRTQWKEMTGRHNKTIGDLCQNGLNVLCNCKDTWHAIQIVKRSVQIIDRWKSHALPPGTCLRVRNYGFQMRIPSSNTCPCYCLIIQGLYQMQLLSLLLACTT